MGKFLLGIVEFWFVIGSLISPYFYYKKTDRSQAPIVRRFSAWGHGLSWPYLAYVKITQKQQQQKRDASRKAAQNAILGDGPLPTRNPTPPPFGGGSPKPGLVDPFEGR